MLKAVYIANNPGSRCTRMVRALAGQVEFHLVARAPVRMETPFVGADYWRTATELKELLEQPWAQEADLWVVAQQLDTEWVPPFASLCRGMNKKVRLVVDVRDQTSLIPKPTRGPLGGADRIEAITLDELSTFRVADGIIHISGDIADACQLLHKNIAGTPIHVVPCMTGAGEFVHEWPAEREGLVYAGGLGPDGPTFRAYHRIAEGMADMGLSPHVYASPTGPNGQEIMDQYTVRGCRVHPRVPDKELIPTLSRHKWGFAGFPNSFPLGNGALPNKLFEYFAAGLPVVIINADAAGALVQHHGVGIWVRNAKQFELLPELLANDELWEAMSQRVLAFREQFNMDAVAPEIVKFFGRVMKRSQTKPGGLRVALESVTVEDPYGEPTNLEELFGCSA